MIELHWVVDRQHDCFSDCFLIFNSIAELGSANVSEVSNWQAVTHNLGVWLLSDIFRISDFFWKLRGGIIIEYGTILGSLWYVWIYVLKTISSGYTAQIYS